MGREVRYGNIQKVLTYIPNKLPTGSADSVGEQDIVGFLNLPH